MTIQEMHDSLVERARERGLGHGYVTLQAKGGFAGKKIRMQIIAGWIMNDHTFGVAVAETIDEAIQRAYALAMEDQ